MRPVSQGTPGPSLELNTFHGRSQMPGECSHTAPGQGRSLQDDTRCAEHPTVPFWSRHPCSQTQWLTALPSSEHLLVCWMPHAGLQAVSPWFLTAPCAGLWCPRLRMGDMGVRGVRPRPVGSEATCPGVAQQPVRLGMLSPCWAWGCYS